MPMEILRAPWRMEYIEPDSSEDKKESKEDQRGNFKTACIFCDFAADDMDEENLILPRGKRSFVIMNKYPYSVGHLLIVPYRHTADLVSLSDEEKLEIFAFSQKSVFVLKKIMNPDGFNIGMNLGKAAGAGIETHLHLHVVPRWSGDINFISVVAETKVLPEALGVSYRKILCEWKIWENP